MNSKDTQMRFLYLLERVGEPLYFSPRGHGQNMLLYDVPTDLIPCDEMKNASAMTRSKDKDRFGSMGTKTVEVRRPTAQMNLVQVANLCPRTTMYSYFNPNHRRATQELEKYFKAEADKVRSGNLQELFNVCSFTRDDMNVNCKLWINAFAHTMLTHPLTRETFALPNIWEVMPDQFFSSAVMALAARQAELPEATRAMIVAPIVTGTNANPENHLAYWREDPGPDYCLEKILALNSHHWHWHLIYVVEAPRTPDGKKPSGRRQGELFYYMHHAMLARYDAERLGFPHLKRLRYLNIDDSPVLKEGYFAGLFETSSFQNWGTRQTETPLVDINRPKDPMAEPIAEEMTLEKVRTYRNRILTAIDSGKYKLPDNSTANLDTDILGDIIEATTYNPNPQYYGGAGLHNAVHAMIAYAHDPNHKHSQAPGPMFETTTAMRDPIFYRWHLYVDSLFDRYKMTLQPYQDKGGEFPLLWDTVSVSKISVQTQKFGSKVNELGTFFRESLVDLARGLDFMRTDMNKLGPIHYKFRHLDHEAFRYNITVSTKSKVMATVRIFLGPKFDEHGEPLPLNQQRKLFFEMDKFQTELNPGDNIIERTSLESSITIPFNQSFRDLERATAGPTPAQSICGCGWPQHLLLPRGSETGQQFDLVVFLTNADDDRVPGSEPPKRTNPNCKKEGLGFCGRLDQPYPDSKPMNYPWDRNPFLVPDPANPKLQMPVKNLQEYVKRIKNMNFIQVTIKHDKKLVELPKDLPMMRQIMARDPGSMQTMCPPRGGRSSASSSSSASANSSSTRPNNNSRPVSMTDGRDPNQSSGNHSTSWARPQQQHGSGRQVGTNPWYPNASHQHNHQHRRPSSPGSPEGWTRVGSRPSSPDWTWGG